MNIINIFRYQVTSFETDRALAFGCALFCFGIAAIPPYGWRTFFFGYFAAVNAFNGWRLHRKITAARQTQSNT